MAHAYTPGLKVTEQTLVRKRRILPLKGEVLVKLDDQVVPEQAVARTNLPGDVSLVNVAQQCNVEPKEVPSIMLKKIGDKVSADEIIARSKSFFGMFKSESKATMEGTIENISDITGQVLLRGYPKPVEVLAYIIGRVCEVVPDEGCVVECRASFIQGIFGIGGETHGLIEMVCQTPEQKLTADLIKPEHKGKILIGGELVTAEALRKAIEVGAAGVVSGGFHDKDLVAFLGYDLGVAITGHEDLGITLIVTEGFGEITMAGKTFELFKSKAGRLASINGATQIRAGVIRPEVVIPIAESDVVNDDQVHHEATMGLEVGSPVRVIRQPYFGRLGEVAGLPSEPTVLESGSKARILKVRFPDGAEVVVPRANVELIES
ncbi:MAG: hypothetical protein P9M14_05485 [Candidatus Alcyoniella australis]|nr:hypothetical protein [Candidatus Alcyoniella australis]